eukprot:4803575-Amphidinium_carterae.1
MWDLRAKKATYIVSGTVGLSATTELAMGAYDSFNWLRLALCVSVSGSASVSVSALVLVCAQDDYKPHATARPSPSKI